MNKNRFYFQMIDSDTGNIIHELSCIKKADRIFQGTIIEKTCECLLSEWLYENLTEDEYKEFQERVIHKV